MMSFGNDIRETFIKPIAERAISRLLEVKNNSIVDSNSSMTPSASSSIIRCEDYLEIPLYSNSNRDNAVMVALITCCVDPARPADTIMKYSAIEALVS